MMGTCQRSAATATRNAPRRVSAQTPRAVRAPVAVPLLVSPLMVIRRASGRSRAVLLEAPLDEPLLIDEAGHP